MCGPGSIQPVIHLGRVGLGAQQEQQVWPLQRRDVGPIDSPPERVDILVMMVGGIHPDNCLLVLARNTGDAIGDGGGGSPIRRLLDELRRAKLGKFAPVVALVIARDDAKRACRVDVQRSGQGLKSASVAACKNHGPSHDYDLPAGFC